MILGELQAQGEFKYKKLLVLSFFDEVNYFKIMNVFLLENVDFYMILIHLE